MILHPRKIFFARIKVRLEIGSEYVVLGLFIDIPHGLSPFTYGISQVNTEISTLGLV